MSAPPCPRWCCWWWLGFGFHTRSRRPIPPQTIPGAITLSEVTAHEVYVLSSWTVAIVSCQPALFKPVRDSCVRVARQGEDGPRETIFFLVFGENPTVHIFFVKKKSIHCLAFFLVVVRSAMVHSIHTAEVFERLLNGVWCPYDAACSQEIQVR